MCDDCDNDYAFLCNYPGSVNTCRPHPHPHTQPMHMMRQQGQSCGVEQGQCMPGLQCVGGGVGGGVCRNFGPGGQHQLGPGGLPPNHPMHMMRQQGQSCGVEQGQCMPGLQCVGGGVGGGVCRNLGPGGQHHLGPGGLPPNHPHHPHNLGPGGQHHLGPGGLPPHVYEGYDDTKINFYFMDGCGFCEKAKKAIKAAGKEHLFNIKSKEEAPKDVRGFPHFEKGGKSQTGYKADINKLIAELSLMTIHKNNN